MAKIAAVQMTSCADVETNLINVEKHIRQAAEQRASLIILPENFAFMGIKESDAIHIAEKQGEGVIQSKISSLAQELKVWVVAGTIPLKSANPNKVNAASIVFDDKGAILDIYNKIHLFDVAIPQSQDQYLESSYIEPGTEVKVVDTPLGKLGLAVCYDIRFPEMFRELVAQGADIICIPAAFTKTTGEAHWHILNRARAIENLSFVVASAQSGMHENKRETFGHSMIINPWGKLLVEMKSGNGVIVAEIDRKEQVAIRKAFPALEHSKII